jgi:hypothetical protein
LTYQKNYTKNIKGDIMKTHRKWWKVFDLTEYTKWIYGKVFVGHQYWGFFCILLTITMILAILFAIIWFKGVDKYNEEHPKRPQASQHCLEYASIPFILNY